jgi:hypothetical protein
VQDGVGEIDLIPTQVYKLGRPQAVAEGDKDHGAIPSDWLLGRRRVVGGRARSRRSDGIRCDEPTLSWAVARGPSHAGLGRLPDNRKYS